jgi:hypothetical protein
MRLVKNNYKSYLFITIKHLNLFRFKLQCLLLYSLGVEANGVEPMTPCVQGRCSSQLSYAPKGLPISLSTDSVGLPGLEPGTSTLSV